MCRDDADVKVDGQVGGWTGTNPVSESSSWPSTVETFEHKKHKKPLVKSPMYLGINAYTVQCKIVSIRGIKRMGGKSWWDLKWPQTVRWF